MIGDPLAGVSRQISIFSAIPIAVDWRRKSF